MRSVWLKSGLLEAVLLRMLSRVWEPVGERARVCIGSVEGPWSWVSGGGGKSRLRNFRRNVTLAAEGRRADWIMCEVGG